MSETDDGRAIIQILPGRILVMGAESVIALRDRPHLWRWDVFVYGGYLMQDIRGGNFETTRKLPRILVEEMITRVARFERKGKPAAVPDVMAYVRRHAEEWAPTRAPKPFCSSR